MTMMGYTVAKLSGFSPPGEGRAKSKALRHFTAFLLDLTFGMTASQEKSRQRGMVGKLLATRKPCLWFGGKKPQRLMTDAMGSSSPCRPLRMQRPSGIAVGPKPELNIQALWAIAIIRAALAGAFLEIYAVLGPNCRAKAKKSRRAQKARWSP